MHSLIKKSLNVRKVARRMAKEMTDRELDFYEEILMFVKDNQLTLEEFETITNSVKKEFKKLTLV